MFKLTQLVKSLVVWFVESQRDFYYIPGVYQYFEGCIIINVYLEKEIINHFDREHLFHLCGNWGIRVSVYIYIYIYIL